MPPSPRGRQRGGTGPPRPPMPQDARRPGRCPWSSGSARCDRGRSTAERVARCGPWSGPEGAPRPRPAANRQPRKYRSVSPSSLRGPQPAPVPARARPAPVPPASWRSPGVPRTSARSRLPAPSYPCRAPRRLCPTGPPGPRPSEPGRCRSRPPRPGPPGWRLSRPGRWPRKRVAWRVRAAVGPSPAPWLCSAPPGPAARATGQVFPARATSRRTRRLPDGAKVPRGPRLRRHARRFRPAAGARRSVTSSPVHWRTASWCTGTGAGAGARGVRADRPAARPRGDGRRRWAASWACRAVSQPGRRPRSPSSCTWPGGARVGGRRPPAARRARRPGGRHRRGGGSRRGGMIGR